MNGDIELIGPKVMSLKGGFGGFYVKSKKEGKGSVKIYYEDRILRTLDFRVIRKKGF